MVEFGPDSPFWPVRYNDVNIAEQTNIILIKRTSLNEWFLNTLMLM